LKIIYLSKNNPAGRAGLDLLKHHVGDAEIQAWFAKGSEPLPDWPDWSCDLLLSYLCPKIVPISKLEQSKLPINFHPAPPEYPGLGCYNFAIYDDAKEYGVTCHRMSPRVDSGEIYRVRRFPMPDSSTVDSLQKRSLVEMHELLNEILAAIMGGNELTRTDEWRRGPTTRADFETLRQVPLDATRDEVERRVKAFANPNFDGAYLRLHGFDFIALSPGRTSK